jgi:hypothetical protein
MQERQIEAALYQEAVYKLSDQFRDYPDGHPDNPWNTYADEFAADATPDEVDTFIESFPSTYTEQYTTNRGLTPSNVLQAYGAIAISASETNTSLTRHSLRKITDIRMSAEHQHHDLSTSSIWHLIDLHNRLFAPNVTLDVARGYAHKKDVYDPVAHISNLRHLSGLQEHEEPTNHSLRTTWRMCVAAKNAQANLGEEMADRNSNFYADEIIASGIKRLYARFPERMEAYCKENGLYLELIESMQSQGLAVPSEYFSHARKTVKAKDNAWTATRLASAYVTNNEEHKAGNLIRLFRDTRRTAFKDELWRMYAVRATENGNYRAAFQHIKRIKDFVGAMKARNDVRQVLIESGDPTLYYETLNTYDGKHDSRKTHAEYTVPMCIKNGDIEGAIDLIEREAPTFQPLGWIVFTQEYIDYEISQGRGNELRPDTIITYAERARRDRQNPKALSSTYGEIYAQLHDAGLPDQAADIKTYVKSLRPEEAKGFSDYIRKKLTFDLIRSKKWLEAMHGDYLQTPDNGLVSVKELLLVAGSIHRERIRRQQAS